MMLDKSVFVHEQALCESDEVGSRTRIWAFAHVMKGARIGADCNICGHAFIESGAIVGDRVTVKNGVLLWEKITIEDEVFLGPNTVFTNDPSPRAAFKKTSAELVSTVVRRGATIGANATVLCGLRIGEFAFVGAGSVVTSDVPAHALVVGNPARFAGWICRCGKRLSDDMKCECGRTYRLVAGTARLASSASDEASENPKETLSLIRSED